ncbi:MAG TPA: DegT/DnrJ/EryC1/StrS family aminotransferase [Baekduia sp.]|nr:DegT/DnrJ/EryC1/StrS family aminotransferase [Baekduia sp.]
MKVPFLDLARENQALAGHLTTAFNRVVKSGRVLYGAELEAFEHEIAAWHGVQYAVGVASGTDAVEIALRAGGLRWARVTAMTAPATLNAMEAADVAADLADPESLTLNAVGCDVHVHLYGLATPALSAAVEDCAHSMGATVNGMLAGTMGRIGALSFYPSKIMGAVGDGGAIITNSRDIAERARAIRHYGMTDTGEVSGRGQNSRLSELQAAFLRAKLPFVADWIARRRAIAKRYAEELHGLVTVPYEPPGARHVYHVYVVEHPERDRLRAALEARGVGTMVHYPRAIHEHARWRHHGGAGAFPVAERLAREALSLPCYPYLTDAEQDHVIKSVKEAV